MCPQSWGSVWLPKFARKEMKASEYRIAHLRDLLLKLLQEKASPVAVNGSMEHRLPGNLSVYLPGIDAEALVVRLRDVAAFSTGARVLVGEGRAQSCARGSGAGSQPGVLIRSLRSRTIQHGRTDQTCRQSSGKGSLRSQKDVGSQHITKIPKVTLRRSHQLPHAR